MTSDAKAPDRTSKTTNGLGSFNKSLAENKQDVNKNFSLNDNTGNNLKPTTDADIRYSVDHDLLRETVEAIDKTPLEKNLEKLEKVHNLKGAGLWLLEPSRIFDAVAGGDKVLFPACAG